MTFASVPSIKLTPSLANEWLPKILNNAYDPRNVPHTEKQALKSRGDDYRDYQRTTSAFFPWRPKS